MLPKLRKPGIPRISVQPQLQEIIIKWPDLWRLQLYCDSPVGFHLITFNDFISVCPSITKKIQELGWGERKTKVSQIGLSIMHERSNSARLKVYFQPKLLPINDFFFFFWWRGVTSEIIKSCLFFTVVKVMMKMMIVAMTRTNIYWAFTRHQILYYLLLLSQMFSN